MPSDWARIRQAVIRRDGGACQICGQYGTEVDHIGHRDDHRPENLRLLCTPCHTRRTAIQAARARQAARASRAADQKSAALRAHPGWVGR